MSEEKQTEDPTRRLAREADGVRNMAGQSCGL
jgi:hypothetical protein